MFNLSLTPFSTITVATNKADTQGTPSVTSIHLRRSSSSSEVWLNERLTMRNGMNFRRLPDVLIRSEPAFRINQVRREERVNQRRLSQTSLTCATRQRERQKPPNAEHS